MADTPDDYGGATVTCREYVRRDLVGGLSPNASEVLGLIRALDDLYRAVVAAPQDWDDAGFGAWLEEIASLFEGPMDRRVAREVRRGVRSARKLQRFCGEGRASSGGSWRSTVDEALGSTAWSPGLELARLGLETDPCEEVFEEVKARFRVVHFSPWMDGVDFAQWAAGSDAPGA